ncbi:hypothetical protein QOZ80_5BG0450140 [Eleusine coracana subsp. coracana]|nr:hypothetical protein QOZ80_5BG0450140 [Eleusine coracana subsp. coracana]
MKRPCRVSREQLAASRETVAVHHHATSRARITHQENGNQGRRRVVRVKVVLTRAEAARLLSLTEHGDKTAAQIVREFKRLQVTRANNDSPSTMKAWRPVLASIPEELP